MREILFKGKSLLSGEWVEGYYIGPIGVLDVHEICDIHDITGTRVEVDPSTVCQYTGMTDKNGTKIFEGDIIQWTNWNGELAMKTTERVEFLCVKSGKILNGFICGH